MMTLINTSGQIGYEPAKAEALAAKLNSEEADGDPDLAWTYVVVHAPEGKGYSHIDVYDEDGEFINRF